MLTFVRWLTQEHPEYLALIGLVISLAALIVNVLC